MLLTYILSASIIYIFTASSLPICFALILAACVTPTDPVLASSILKGKFANRYIPRHLRNALIVESGINDGLAYPLLTLPLFFIQSKLAAIIRKSDSLDKYTTLTDHILLQLFSKHPLDRKDFFTITKKWFLTTLFYEIVFACFYGLFIGFIFKKALLFSKRKNLIDKENDLSFLLGLSLVVTGTTGLLASDDILASFFCGIAFSYTTENIKEQKCKFNEENNKIECEIVNPDDDNQYFQGDFEHDQPVCSDDFYEPSPQEEAVVINIDHQGKNITETTKLDSTSSSHSYINQHANGVRSEMNNYFHQNTPASTGESHLMRQLPNKQHNNNHDFYEILDILINSMFFMIFGYFIKISPKYFILSIILLLIKRLPIFMVLPLFRNKRERFFAGWYGPVGVGALFFMSHFKHELFATHLKKSALTDKIENIVEEMEIITNTIVFVSVLLHGTTAIIINLALRKKKLNEEEMYFVSESEISEIN